MIGLPWCTRNNNDAHLKNVLKNICLFKYSNSLDANTFSYNILSLTTHDLFLDGHVAPLTKDYQLLVGDRYGAAFMNYMVSVQLNVDSTIFISQS